jgi:hypothetical protein
MPRRRVDEVFLLVLGVDAAPGSAQQRTEQLVALLLGADVDVIDGSHDG